MAHTTNIYDLQSTEDSYIYLKHNQSPQTIEQLIKHMDTVALSYKKLLTWTNSGFLL